jgi:hypothetical protein
MRDFGPSTEEWLALSFHGEAIETRVDRNSKCSPRAGILEMNLMEDQVFVADLRATKECLGSELLRKLWYYDYAANAMAEVNSNHDISAWTGRPVPHGCTELLNALCRRWCLSAVSNAVGSIRRHGLYITVSRPKVSWRRDGTGVDVFIPRFYKYNDLANYRHGDFRPLLAAMARIFPTDRLQRRQTARIQEAMRYRASLVERGNAPVKAWEKTRMKFSWSPRTATDYLGPRPRR